MKNPDVTILFVVTFIWFVFKFYLYTVSIDCCLIYLPGIYDDFFLTDVLKTVTLVVVQF